MQMTTQVQRRKVLEYIAAHGSITQAEAFRIGIGRLSARVWDLHHTYGWDLPKTMEKNKNNSGRHAVYHMSAKDMERMEAGD